MSKEIGNYEITAGGEIVLIRSIFSSLNINRSPSFYPQFLETQRRRKHLKARLLRMCADSAGLIPLVNKSFLYYLLLDSYTLYTAPWSIIARQNIEHAPRFYKHWVLSGLDTYDISLLRKDYHEKLNQQRLGL